MGPAGAIIMSFFAMIFCLIGLAPLYGYFNIGSVIAFLVSAVVIVISIMQLRAFKGGEVTSPRIAKIIMWSSVAEGIGIFIVINILNNIGMEDRLVAGITLVVALHFLPMAYFIPFRRFYILFAGLTVMAIVGFTVSAPLGAAVAGLGAAIGLWAASAIALQQQPV